ncbi:VWA domain-containing protein [Paenibacillus sp. FSL P4-0288]|uniref:VWA domain-containing protein n=1 Tax=Paenibacillus sp. FSL P4-0288 TaxID=2921633 RepID=UPI0030F82016
MSIYFAKKNLIDLTKKAEIVIQNTGLGTQKAKISVAFDISGSMRDRYQRNEVQETSDRLLPLAIIFDDNRSLDMFAFNEEGFQLGEVSEQNFYQFVQKNVSPLVDGGTEYAPVMKMILESYGIHLDKKTPSNQSSAKGFFSKVFGVNKKTPGSTLVSEASTPTPLDEPIFVIFETDGDNFDHKATEEIIRLSSHYGVFWKFVGIGNERFRFLEKLDDLPGRLIDNANFIAIKDVSSISDEMLYEDLLKEFPEWIVEARNKGLIK